MSHVFFEAFYYYQTYWKLIMFVTYLKIVISSFNIIHTYYTYGRFYNYYILLIEHIILQHVTFFYQLLNLKNNKVIIRRFLLLPKTFFSFIIIQSLVLMSHHLLFCHTKSNRVTLSKPNC